MIDSKTCAELLEYCPITGIFLWRKWRGNTAKSGSVAGATDSKGYRQIRVNGTLHMAHRLAWLLVYGEWPLKDIDHIDRNPLNNAISNLRECTMAENQQNVGIRSDNTSGATGVYWIKPQKKWLATICVKGKTINLGRFLSFDDAVATRFAAKQKLHTFGAQRGVDFNQR